MTSSYKGRLSKLREGIQDELGAQLGRSRTSFRLWQDKEAIAPGKLWQSEIKTAVEQSVFFIPIVTPRAVNSDYCKFEFEAFLAREHALGRADLVFPILYVPVPALANEAQWRDHPVLSAIARRQYVDWQAFRYSDVDTPAPREAIARFCRKIVEALDQSWLSPEERQRQEEAKAQRKEEEEQRQKEAQAKRRDSEEERLRKDAAEAQEAERIAREHADEKRRRDAAAERARVEEEVQERAKAEALRLKQETNRDEEIQRQKRQKEEKTPKEKEETVSRTTAPAPSNITFLQVVCALLVLQGIVRAWSGIVVLSPYPYGIPLPLIFLWCCGPIVVISFFRHCFAEKVGARNWLDCGWLWSNHRWDVGRGESIRSKMHLLC